MESAEAECSEASPASGRDLDLDVRKLDPLMQGGAIAAATAVTCPLKGKAQVRPQSQCHVLSGHIAAAALRELFKPGVLTYSA